VNMNFFFYFNNNKLSGRLPSELGQLRHLTADAYFYSNLLCGDVPSEVAALTSWWDIDEGNSLGTPCCQTLPNT